MTGDDIARLIYLLMLALAVGGYLLVSSRETLTKSIRDFAVWGLIFLGAIAGYGLWGDIQDDILPRQSVVQDSGEITVPQSPDGHYYLTLQINGTPIRFVVDTGATDMVLSLADAKRAGLDVDGLAFLGVANTANGPVRTAGVRLAEVTLGPVRDENLPASVNSGEMRGSLLGMNYLNRFDRLEIKDGKLSLAR